MVTAICYDAGIRGKPNSSTGTPSCKNFKKQSVFLFYKTLMIKIIS